MHHAVSVYPEHGQVERLIVYSRPLVVGPVIFRTRPTPSACCIEFDAPLFFRVGRLLMFALFGGSTEDDAARLES